MGNQLGAAQQPDYNNLPELQALAFVERLGGGRFLKTLKCAMSASGAGAGGAAGRSSEGGEAAWPAAGGSQLLVIKVYVKRDASERLSAYEEMLAEVRSRLSLEAAPNVMPFQWYRETQHVAYLARQYLHSTLLDRLATPPFLTRHEKLWFSFQLLQALAQCHGAGVVHGDIKGENVLVTSAGWVLLTDLGNFKPALLPADDPADFSFYFDGGGARRSCYLAPERFGERPLSSHPTASAGLQPSMDVFSAGCVLLELLLECGPAFDLPKLLRFRKGEGGAHLAALLARVEPPPLQAVLRGMTTRDPADRPTATECLQALRGEVLAEAFYSYAHPFLGSLRLLDCERQASGLCDAADEILKQLGPPTAPPPAAEPPAALPATAAPPHATPPPATTPSAAGALASATGLVAPATEIALANGMAGSGAVSSGAAAGRLEGPAGAMWAEAGGAGYLARVEERWRREAEAPAGADQNSSAQNNAAQNTTAQNSTSPTSAAARPSSPPSPPLSAPSSPPPSPLVVAVAPFCACVRNVRSASLLLRLLRTLLRVALASEDAVKTQRVLPYFIACLASPLPVVRAEALHLIVDLLASVLFLQPADTRLLPDYVLPAVGRCATDPEPLVRCALGSRLGQLATTARRFLETAQWVRTLSHVDRGTGARAAGGGAGHAGGAGGAGGGGVGAGGEGAGGTAGEGGGGAAAASGAAGVGGACGGGGGGLCGCGVAACGRAGEVGGGFAREGMDAVTASTLRSFDTELAALQDQVSHIAVTLLTDAHSTAAVKRSLLSGATALALFLDRQNTNDMLLPLLITFLNDRDPTLRAAFFEGIGGVCAFVGRASLQAFVLPCIMQALTDVDEPVVCAALESLCRLSEFGLHPRASLLEVTSKVAPLLCHPNARVRHAASGFVSTLSSHFTPAEAFARVRPLLRPFLLHPLPLLSPAALRAALRPPPSRLTFDRALAAASEQAEPPFAAPYGRLASPRGRDGTRRGAGDGGEMGVGARVAAGAGSVDACGGAAAEAIEMLLQEGALPDDDDTGGGDTGGGLGREPGDVSAFGLGGGGLFPPHGIPSPTGLEAMPAIAEEAGESGAGLAPPPSPRPASPPRAPASPPSPRAPPPCAPPPPPPLDLSALPDLTGEEAVTLQAMREYIRAASVVKLAKIRMWETDNSALLQLDGGGGGAELLAYRNLSRRIPVQRLAPPPSATPHPSPASHTHAPYHALGADVHSAAPASTPPARQASSPPAVSGHGGMSPRAPPSPGARGEPSPGPFSDTSDGGVSGLSRTGSSLFRASLAAPRRESPARNSGAAGGGDGGGGAGQAAEAGGGYGGGNSGSPPWGRIPAAGYAAGGGQGSGGGGGSAGSAGGGRAGTGAPRQPRGSQVAQLRAHSDGVRALSLTGHGTALLSLGQTGPALKLWPLRAIESEGDHATPAAAHALHPGARALFMAACAGGRDVALATGGGGAAPPGSSGVGMQPSAPPTPTQSRAERVSILSLDRLGSAGAVSFKLPVEASAGRLVGVGMLGAGGAPGLVLVATEDGVIRAVDARANRSVWELRHERRLGLMRAWTSGSCGAWLAAGSSTGHVALWDVRYALRVACWRTAAAAPIRAMAHATPPPNARGYAHDAAAAPGRPVLFLGGAGGVVTGWGMGPAVPKCLIALQPAGVADTEAATAAAAAVDAASAEAASLGRTGASLSGMPIPVAIPLSHGGEHSITPPEIRALLVSSDGSAVATGSTDRVVRLWRPGCLPEALPPEGEAAGGAVHAGGGGMDGLCVPIGGGWAAGSACVVRRLPGGTLLFSQRGGAVGPHDATLHNGGVGGAGGVAGTPFGGAAGNASSSSLLGPGDALGGGSPGGCQGAITSLLWSGAHSPGLLFGGSLAGVVHVWR